MYFTQAMAWICDVCGYDYYQDYTKKDETKNICLSFLDDIEPQSNKKDEDILRRLDESVLNEFVQLPNKWFYDEGINLQTQELFEVGFFLHDDRITIPIRDENGILVGVKARTINPDYEKLGIPKYNFPYSTSKTQLLYGLDKTLPFIKEKGEVIVFEGEKSVMKAYAMGYKNSVSIGGHKLSPTQVLKLEKLNVMITLALDKNVDKDKMWKEIGKFIFSGNLRIIWDAEDLLGEKDSPVDKGLDTWEKLYSKKFQINTK